MIVSPCDILAIGIHPDDVELSCSGTILIHQQQGYSCGILDLTLGELGTRGNASVRTAEAMKSAKVLGVKFRHQLNLGDGVFENNHETRLKIIEIVRAVRPKIVLANAISDRHPDHGRAAQLISDACYYSGLNKIESIFDGQKQACWRPDLVLHYIQDNFIHPDIVVDVTSVADKKREAIMCFSSQFYNPESKEPETPISSPEFLESLFSKMSVFGRSIGVKYAEGFSSKRYLGTDNLFKLK